MLKKKVIWLSPSNNKKSENIMSVWEREMKNLGWDTQANASEADFIFCGSESQLDRAVKISKELQLPIICYFWGFPWFRLIQRQFDTHYKNRIDLMRSVSVFLTPSQTVTLQLADFGFVSQVVIPGIDDRKIAETNTESIPKLPTITSIGRLVPHKSHDYLIGVCGNIEPRVPLNIIGQGDLEDELLESARTKKVDLTIHNVDDLEKFKMLRAAGIFITCSEYEGFGAPIPEAMACGIPVIANRIPVFTELYTDYILYYEDATHLSELIIKLFSDREFYLHRVKLQSILAPSFFMTGAAGRLQAILLGLSSQLVKSRLAKKIREIPDSAQEVYEEEAQRNWDISAYRFDPHWLRHWRVEFALKELKGKIVLDLGCAYGAYAIRFAEKGFQVTAADISNFYLKKVSEHAIKYDVARSISTVQCDALAIPCVDSFYDSVWVGELLEHVPEPAKLLKEAVRVVKPGGVVVFSTPYKEHHYDSLHLHIWKSRAHFKSIVLDPLSDTINIKRLDLIAEGNLDPSVIFGVIEKR